VRRLGVLRDDLVVQYAACLTSSSFGEREMVSFDSDYSGRAGRSLFFGSRKFGFAGARNKDTTTERPIDRTRRTRCDRPSNALRPDLRHGQPRARPNHRSFFSITVIPRTYTQVQHSNIKVNESRFRKKLDVHSSWLLLLDRIHDVGPHGILHAVLHVVAGVQEVAMLEDQYTTAFGHDVYLLLHVPAVKCGRAALQLTLGIVEVQVKGEIRPLFAVRGFVCAIAVRFIISNVRSPYASGTYL
jgi:hypothetical protein